MLGDDSSRVAFVDVWRGCRASARRGLAVSTLDLTARFRACSWQREVGVTAAVAAVAVAAAVAAAAAAAAA